MIELIDEMPPRTIGFRASGKLTLEDYRNVLEPGLRGAIESGELRMVFVLEDFGGLEPRAWPEDVKTGLKLGFGHHSAWKRSAIVTDIEWISKAFQLFAWMTPGEVKVFALADLADAREWVTG